MICRSGVCGKEPMSTQLMQCALRTHYTFSKLSLACDIKGTTQGELSVAATHAWICVQCFIYHSMGFLINISHSISLHPKKKMVSHQWTIVSCHSQLPFSHTCWHHGRRGGVHWTWSTSCLAAKVVLVVSLLYLGLWISIPLLRLVWAHWWRC